MKYLKNIFEYKVNNREIEQEDIIKLINYIHFKLGLSKSLICNILKQGCKKHLQNEKLNHLIQNCYDIIIDDTYENQEFYTYPIMLDIVSKISDYLKVDKKIAFEIFKDGYFSISHHKEDKHLLKVLHETEECLHHLKF